MSWITPADVTVALGASTVIDTAWLDEVTPAADAWAQRKRAQTGRYPDDTPDVAPSADAKLGTVLYAVALYRERASADSFVSFDELAAGPVMVGAMGQIKRLLGVGGAQVDRPVSVTAARLRRWQVIYGR
jgi:hypothetical protein